MLPCKVTTRTAAAGDSPTKLAVEDDQPALPSSKAASPLGGFGLGRQSRGVGVHGKEVLWLKLGVVSQDLRLTRPIRKPFQNLLDSDSVNELWAADILASLAFVPGNAQ